jgi:GTPase SAR1 family protein
MAMKIGGETMSKMKKIFISYSHNDKKWITQLLKHMKKMQDRGEWEVRYDISDIKVGDDWLSIIKDLINYADAIILLVSKSFFDSTFILREEIPPILQRMDREDVKVFPLISEPCEWKKKDWLKAIEVRPKGKSLEELPEDERDPFLSEFMMEIKEALKEGAIIRINISEEIINKPITFGLLHVRDGKDMMAESGPLLNDELFFKNLNPPGMDKEVTVQYRGNLGFQFKCFADYDDSKLSFDEVTQLLERNGFKEVSKGGGVKKRAWFLLKNYPTYTTVDGLRNNFFYPS